MKTTEGSAGVCFGGTNEDCDGVGDAGTAESGPGARVGAGDGLPDTGALRIGAGTGLWKSSSGGTKLGRGVAGFTGTCFLSAF